MATHALGNNTCNLSINMPVQERDILGRLAFGENRSTGNFVDTVLMDGLRARYPAAAAAIENARLAHAAAVAQVRQASLRGIKTARRSARPLLLCAIGAGILFQVLNQEQCDMRRVTVGRVAVRGNGNGFRRSETMGLWEEEEA